MGVALAALALGGLWFEDFAATTDDEVRRWLDRFASDHRGERSSA